MSFADFCGGAELSAIERAGFEADVRFLQGQTFNHRPSADWQRMLTAFRNRARVNRRV